MNCCDNIRVWSQNIEMREQERKNKGIEHKFEPDNFKFRYRVNYTVIKTNITYTRIFQTLELAEFIYNNLLLKDNYKNVCLYEVSEHRRKINE